MRSESILLEDNTIETAAKKRMNPLMLPERSQETTDSFETSSLYLEINASTKIICWAPVYTNAFEKSPCTSPSEIQCDRLVAR
jgi:hypothetical protein